MKNTIALLITCTFLVAGNSAFAEKTSYEGVMKTIPHLTVAFDEGSSTLTKSTKEDIRNMIHDAQASGKVEKVVVAAWSDRALPAKEQSLSTADRALAEHRGSALSHFLNNALAITKVDTHNMAETSSWLAKTLNTSDEELKSVFSKRGAAAPMKNAEFQVIKNEGGPSEAVLVVIREIAK